MHVRRADAVKMCDTSVDAVGELLECAQQTFGELFPPTHVVLFTDAANATYRHELTARLRAASRGACVVFGEDLVSEIIAEANALSGQLLRDHPDLLPFSIDPANNYLRYAVSVAVQRRARVSLEKRKDDHCSTCDQLRVLRDRHKPPVVSTVADIYDDIYTNASRFFLRVE